MYSCLFIFYFENGQIKMFYAVCNTDILLLFLGVRRHIFNGVDYSIMSCLRAGRVCLKWLGLTRLFSLSYFQDDEEDSSTSLLGQKKPGYHAPVAILNAIPQSDEQVSPSNTISLSSFCNKCRILLLSSNLTENLLPNLIAKVLDLLNFPATILS
jgi:hypothetical protein